MNAPILTWAEFSLQFIERIGGKVDSLRSDLGKYIPRNPELKPQLAYLEIESNDLRGLITRPDILTKSIYDLCHYLHYGHGVHRVIVGMILHRQAKQHRYFDRQLSLSAYNKRADDLNTGLKSMAANNSSFISFWRHKGFTSPLTRPSFDAVDGVHPSRNMRGSPPHWQDLHSMLLMAFIQAATWGVHLPTDKTFIRCCWWRSSKPQHGGSPPHWQDLHSMLLMAFIQAAT